MLNVGALCTTQISNLTAELKPHMIWTSLLSADLTQRESIQRTVYKET